MDTLDYRGKIASALTLDPARKAKKAGPVLQFRCPRHADDSPSAWLGDGAWGCRACGFQESLISLGDELGIERPHRSRGVTVEQYAEHKGFTIDALTRWGVYTATGRYGTDEVRIPYYAEDGTTVLREKIRIPKGTIWGAGSGTYLYGLNHLAKADAKKPVLLVEGESDCHAAWHIGVLAIGIPGASLWKPEYAQLFAGRDVFLWQEPDGGGATLVAKVMPDLPNMRVIVAGSDGIKDVADLYKRSGPDFKAALKIRMAQALRPGQTPSLHPFDRALGANLDQLKLQKQAPIDAVITPFASWNLACRGAGGGMGLARGWHVTLAANTGFGKSLIALNMAAAAMLAGEHVTFISLEMSQEECVTRLLSIISGEDARHLDAGRWFDEAAFDRAAKRMNELHERTGGAVSVNRHHISDLPGILTSMRQQHEYEGSRMVITDYLQLASVQGEQKLMDRITRVSHEIRDTNALLKGISVGVSQYNRETSKDRENPPTPQGLMGGSALENDSAQVLLLDHTTYQRQDGSSTAKAILNLAKNRHGPLVKIPLMFNYTDLSITEHVPQVIIPASHSFYERSEADDSGGGDTSFETTNLQLL